MSGRLSSADKNLNLICKQIKIYKPNFFIINNFKVFQKVKTKIKKTKTKIVLSNYFNYKSLAKSDITLSAIPGLDGLTPTIEMIKKSKKLFIANKESIICGWDIISKNLKKNKTNFIPVDSEHFSLWYALQNINKNLIEKIYLTASGGPFYKIPLTKFKDIKINEALNHPNWKMGNKISIDSATMINKVYEVIEAKNIFNIQYKKINILIHPKSYIHALIKFKNGLIKIIAHDTTMKIPIFNSLFYNSDQVIKTENLNINQLNNLNLKFADNRRYPMINILGMLPNNHTLFDTIIVTINDELVNLVLISF